METSCLIEGGGLWPCLPGIIRLFLVHTCVWRGVWAERKGGWVGREIGSVSPSLEAWGRAMHSVHWTGVS